MKRDLSIQRDYDYPPELVWRALTDTEALSRWMMPNDFKAQVGHKFTFRTDAAPGFDGVTYCEVLEVDPPKTLAYTFTGGGLDTVVRYHLNPVANGTRLVVEHTGFAGVRAYLISFLMEMGNRKLYDKLFPEYLKQLAVR